MRHLLLLLFMLTLFCVPPVMAAEHPKWSGVDETVVEKFARDLGREPKEPFLATDQGDLLLFFFTLAGAVGGFVMGYYWHKLFVAKMDMEQKKR